MGKFAYSLVLALSVLLLAISSKSQDKVELFGGYSFVRAPVTLTETAGACALNCPALVVGTHLNMNGWEASGAYKLFGPLSLTTDFSGHYASFKRRKRAPTHLSLWAPGSFPQARLPVCPPVIRCGA